jgi:hypothetical protein
MAALAVGCGAESSGGDITTDSASIHDAGGYVRSYAGRGVGDALARTGEPPVDAPWMMVRFPVAYVDEALARSGRVKTWLLEDPVDVELTIHWYGPDRVAGDPLLTETFRAGQPWFTGVAQVWVPEGTPIGLFDATVYVHGPGGTLSIQRHVMGLVPDPDTPSPRYAGPAESWPPLPPHWELPTAE